MKPPRAIINKDGMFNDFEMLQSSAQLKLTTIRRADEVQKTHFEVELSDLSTKQKPRAGLELDFDMKIFQPDGESERDKGIKDYQLVIDMEKSLIRPHTRYTYVDLIVSTSTIIIEVKTDEPKTYSEAIKSGKLEELKKAMD